MRPGTRGLRRFERSTSGDLRNDEDFAVGADRFEEGVLIDLPVDRDGHPFLEVPGQSRVTLDQQLEQVLDGGLDSIIDALATKEQAQALSA